MDEIIDFERKGNQIKFFLGKNGKQYGDDWNDIPYEHNAEKVYQEYISGEKVITFDFDDYVFEPCDGCPINSGFSKLDMIARKVPCIIVIKKKDVKDSEWIFSFRGAMQHKKVKKYYFGDTL